MGQGVQEVSDINAVLRADEARVARGRCPVEGCNQPHDHVSSHHWSSDYDQ